MSKVTIDRDIRTGRAIGAGRRPTGPVASFVLIVGAALLVTSAVIHLHLWASGYRYIPTIGPLFFVQGVLGIILTLLIALTRRAFIAVIGALFAAGTLAGLLVSVHIGLFGHRTAMGAPWALTSAVIEGAAVVVLCSGAALAVSIERAHIRRWRSYKAPTP